MSILQKMRLRSQNNEVNLLTLSADQLVEKTSNGRTYQFFIVGTQVLTLKAIATGIAKGAITVEETEDEVIIQMNPGYQSFTTESGFIGFGTKAITARELLSI